MSIRLFDPNCNVEETYPDSSTGSNFKNPLLPSAMDISSSSSVLNTAEDYMDKANNQSTLHDIHRTYKKPNRALLSQHSDVILSSREMIKQKPERSLSYIETTRGNISSLNERCESNLPMNVDYVKQITDDLKQQNKQGKVHEMFTVVAFPSIDLDGKELERFALPSDLESYEERHLYHLLLLKNPSVNVIFLTSINVDLQVVAYYLSLIQIDLRCSISRLFMLSPNENTSKPLSKKILARPGLIRVVKEILHNKECRAGLCAYTGSPTTSVLSQKLGLRLLSNSTHHWGTKHGSREIFHYCNIEHPCGTPSFDGSDDDLLSLGDVTKCPSRYWVEHQKYIRTPHALAIGLARQIMFKTVRPKRWMIKLNLGFSGRGNATLDLTQIQGKQYNSIDMMAKDIEEALPTMVFEDPTMTWNGKSQHGFSSQMKRLGCIGEAFIDCLSPASPSVQAVVEISSMQTPVVRVLSTHEQILGGQTYLGCEFPACAEYRQLMVKYGEQIGFELSRRGAQGHYSVDFIAQKQPDGNRRLFAVEINLRQGGTTHPFTTMEILCDGMLDSEGVFRCHKDKSPRCYLSTDNFTCDDLKILQSKDILDALLDSRHALDQDIKWNHESRIGVIFHTFRFVDLRNKIGFTCIGRDKGEVQQLYKNTESFFSKLAKLK